MADDAPAQPPATDEHKCSCCDDDDGTTPLLLALLAGSLVGGSVKKRRKPRNEEPRFSVDQEGLRLPDHGPDGSGFTWDEMTTDLAELGFAFGDVILYKPTNDLCRAVGYEKKKDRLWTTSTNKSNAVACFSGYSKCRDDLEKYDAAPETTE